MAQNKKSDGPVLVAGAENALTQMKYDVASEISLNVPAGDYWGNVSSKDCGRVGGQMVKKLIHIAESQIKMK